MGRAVWIEGIMGREDLEVLVTGKKAKPGEVQVSPSGLVLPWRAGVGSPGVLQGMQ